MKPYQKRAIVIIIFALGLIALLVGVVTDIYDVRFGIFTMIAIWFIGGSAASLIMGEKSGTESSKFH